MKSNIVSLYDSTKKTLKDVAEKGRRRRKQENMKETQEHERALKGDHKIFVALGLSKTDTDGYVDRVKTQFKVLIESEENPQISL